MWQKCDLTVLYIHPRAFAVYGLCGGAAVGDMISAYFTPATAYVGEICVLSFIVCLGMFSSYTDVMVLVFIISVHFRAPQSHCSWLWVAGSGSSDGDI